MYFRRANRYCMENAKDLLSRELECTIADRKVSRADVPKNSQFGPPSGMTCFAMLLLRHLSHQ